MTEVRSSSLLSKRASSRSSTIHFVSAFSRSSGSSGITRTEPSPIITSAEAPTTATGSDRPTRRERRSRTSFTLTTSTRSTTRQWPSTPITGLLIWVACEASSSLDSASKSSSPMISGKHPLLSRFDRTYRVIEAKAYPGFCLSCLLGTLPIRRSPSSSLDTTTVCSRSRVRPTRRRSRSRTF